MLAVCLCVSIVQLCGCSLVVLGLYLHADRQSSIYLDLLMTRQGGSTGPGVESALYLDLLQSVPVSGPLVITGHLAKVLVVMVTRYTRCHGNGRSNAQLPRLLWRLRRQRLLPMPREHR